MTATVLLVSELGTGMGHAKRLLSVALALQRMGMNPVAALRELWVCADDFQQAGVPVLQAPAHRGHWPPGPVRISSYADMSAACGYHSADALWPMMLGWNALFDLVRPKVVVADYSPLATLAAYDRHPVLAIGDGFVLPPSHLPRMPMLRQEQSRMTNDNEQIEHASSVMRRLGRRAPTHLPALIAGQAHVVCTYPEIDLYASLRTEPAQGSLLPNVALLPPVREPRIFIYLKSQSSLTMTVIKAAAETRMPIEAYVPDMSGEQKQTLQQQDVSIHETPPSMNSVLSRCSLVIHHGGVGTLENCLAAGRPQLLIPSQFEQTLNARTCVNKGLAVSIEKTDTAESLSNKIDGLATGRTVSAEILAVAQLIAGRHATRAIDSILGHCAELARH